MDSFNLQRGTPTQDVVAVISELHNQEPNDRNTPPPLLADLSIETEGLLSVDIKQKP